MIDLTIVSGASRGIGRYIFSDLAPISQNIIGIGSSEKILELSLIGNATALRADLTDYNATYYRTKELINKFAPKTLAVVLCGAQLGEPGGLFNSEEPHSGLEDWDKLYKCNVLGNIAIIKACQDRLKDGCKTRVVFFAGGGAAYGRPEFGGYALSKTAAVRAVENIGMEFEKNEYNASIIALAPGAVETDMLKKVIASGEVVKTKTDISEPTNFVHKFLTDEFDSKKINGRFIHCKDIIKDIDFSDKKNLFSLRRIDMMDTKCLFCFKENANPQQYNIDDYIVSICIYEMDEYKNSYFVHVMKGSLESSCNNHKKEGQDKYTKLNNNKEEINKCIKNIKYNPFIK